MRKTLVGVLLLSLLLAAPAGAKTVNRKQPPRVFLRTHSGVVQEAGAWSYCWSYSTGDNSGTGMCADGFPDYGTPVPVKRGVLFFRIRYPEKPKEASVSAYDSVDGNGMPQGDAQKIPSHLKAFRLEGRVVGWDAVFKLRSAQDYYLDLFIRVSQGDVSYAAAVSTTSEKPDIT